MELQRNRNSVYQIGYHLVWCTKYRKPLLVGEIANFVKTLFLKIADDNEFVIQEMEIMPDHVHLFITATPAHIIVDIVKALKACRHASCSKSTRISNTNSGAGISGTHPTTWALSGIFPKILLKSISRAKRQVLRRCLTCTVSPRQECSTCWSPRA